LAPDAPDDLPKTLRHAIASSTLSDYSHKPSEICYHYFVKESTLSNILDADRNPEILQDTEIVCRKMNGWGAAFRRLRERSDLSQSEVADVIGVERTSLSNWEQEKHFPQPDTLRKALAVIGVDARLLFRYFGLQLEGEKALEVLNAQISPNAAALTLAQTLIQLADRNKQEVSEAITTLMDSRILAAISLKALSDVQAAKLYFERSDKIQEARSDPRRLLEAEDIFFKIFRPQPRNEQKTS